MLCCDTCDVTVLSCVTAGEALQDAQHNRDYVVQKLSNEIHEIIRVLQLTTYDEEEWDADDITIMKKAQVGRQTVVTSVRVAHSEMHKVVNHKLVNCYWLVYGRNQLVPSMFCRCTKTWKYKNRFKIV